jgi:hypothetical protein
MLSDALLINGMARPQFADGGDDLQLWWVAADIRQGVFPQTGGLPWG